MNAQLIRLVARLAATAALAIGFVLGAASSAGAQLPPLPIPPGEEAPAPDEGGAPDAGSPLPDALDPLLDPLAPVLDPLLEQIPGGDAEVPPEDETPGDAGDGSTGDGAATPPPSESGSVGGATLPRTGGTVAVGLASSLAAAGLVLRRFLRS